MFGLEYGRTHKPDAKVSGLIPPGLDETHGRSCCCLHCGACKLWLLRNLSGGSAMMQADAE